MLEHSALSDFEKRELRSLIICAEAFKATGVGFSEQFSTDIPLLLGRPV